MKITPREKRRHACRLFSRGVIFTRARVSLALLSLEEKWGTTRSLKNVLGEYASRPSMQYTQSSHLSFLAYTFKTTLYALDEFVLRYQIATFYFTKSLAPTETRITPQGEKQIAFHSTFEMACILD